MNAVPSDKPKKSREAYPCCPFCCCFYFFFSHASFLLSFPSSFSLYALPLLLLHNKNTRCIFLPCLFFLSPLPLFLSSLSRIELCFFFIHSLHSFLHSFIHSLIHSFKNLDIAYTSAYTTLPVLHIHTYIHTYIQ
ncbi:hypothetical protein K457DRAFT_375062 [Linnemannia elongata AG-77]|uniref:Uncharacterized protein n=1 Tax=Linnemannia elongata AG-77 TaxID=1314771 RepID=A0A197KEK3_9FUNG|nr:hypothetical protein K457DRAFT_375062 [Linnemannia elongata AG-77]